MSSNQVEDADDDVVDVEELCGINRNRSILTKDVEAQKRNFSFNNLADESFDSINQRQSWFTNGSSIALNTNYRSLPASPLMNENRKFSSTTSSTTTTRRSNGRYLFQSPKVIRKLRKK